MKKARVHFVITGASQGIGAAIARQLATLPNASLVLAARNRQRLDAVAQECQALGAETLVVPCDVTDAEAVAHLHDEVGTRWGVPDAVINNAGQFVPGALADTSEEAFRGQIDANLVSAFLVTRAFLPDMVARGRGHLFFMASVAAVRGYPGGVAYCAAKHGLLGLARAIRAETIAQGIRVTTLLPGATWTPSWDGAGIEEQRMMPAEDIARVVHDTWLLSDRTVVEEILIRPLKGDL